MTAITFSLSATFPGETEGQPWDADWTAFATALAWTDTVTNEMSSRVRWSLSLKPEVSQLPFSTTSGAVNSGSVDVPAETTFNDFSQETITVDYGAFSIPAAVSVISYSTGNNPGAASTGQFIGLNAPWNSVKDIEVSTISAQSLTVFDFVDTWINAPTDNSSHDIEIENAKRGAVALGDGNDGVQVDVAANEYTWSSHFDITVGNGNDTVRVGPTTVPPDDHVMYNRTPQLTTANISVGNGNDTVDLTAISGNITVGNGNDTVDLWGAVSTVQVGSGVDRINIYDGDSVVWLGAGSDTVTIAGAGMTSYDGYSILPLESTIHVGAGHADIWVEDLGPELTPKTTIDFIHGETGGSTSATADVVRYGNFVGAPEPFVGGDMSALTIELSGYSPGSTVSLADTPAGGPMLLQIHDAATGSIDAVTLYAAVTGSAVLQHIRFA
jgi:hypothetical protein